MERVLWSLGLVVTFVLGLVAGSAIRPGPSAVQRETVERLQQQISTLQARLHTRDSSAQPGAAAPSGPRPGPAGARAPWFDRVTAAAMTEDPVATMRTGRSGGAVQSGSATGGAAARSDSRLPAGAPPTVEAALERFQQYVEALNMPEGRDRGRQLRELFNELRGMGDVAGRALMQVLASAGDSDERRTAARLLGNLQVSAAVPLLQDVIQREDDVLLRRAAASGLRQLRTPESLPVMERVLANPAEDRFVRLSAAYGLAESGKPLGVAGLARIFEESAGDGRGRALAFRALTSLNDERPLPFLRQLVTSEAEPAYRLQAIRYLTTQGDQQALPALQAVMHATNEQPSIRDAAAQAYRTLGGR